MRMKYGKLLIVFMICFNLVVFYYSWRYILANTSFLGDSFGASDQGDFDEQHGYSLGERGLSSEAMRLSVLRDRGRPTRQTKLSRIQERIENTNKFLRKSITVIFRDFYDFDNDLMQSIASVTNLIPNIQVFVISPEIPYPPLDVFLSTSQTSNQTSWFEKDSNVRFFSLSYDVTKSLQDTLPILQIKTKYTLFLPDSVRLNGRALLTRILKEITSPSQNDLLLHQHQNLLLKQNNQAPLPNLPPIDPNAEPQRKILAIPFASNQKSIANCCHLQLDLPNWTLEYVTGNETDNCDMYKQKHAILVETELLREMADALSDPFPELFYIQSKLANVKKVLLNASFQDGKKLFTSYHTKTKRRNARKEQFKTLYRKLQIKKVVRKNYLYDKSKLGKRKLIKSFEHNNQTISLLTEITFYGCEKQTKSCIGQVYNSQPFYVYLGRHTPPCCLDKLKAIFRHVVDEFENVGIRYWLDNYALKNAIELKSLSPDAYEIDLSFNSDDIQRSVAMKKALTRPFTDGDGFHWLKATDGHYFRVQYSKVNQIAVNLLPFDLSGESVRPNGFYGWKAKKFSVEFLHPMSTVLFLGKPVMCPNNVMEYLETKSIK
ncbi:ribitol 5-phosphate transferase FKRP [Uranotaenia lowii]|uniref:ribitol 5-phosphate transferase FKRP n=1 Tax=Uranotaenia lowii TaxID=190385 RepID=UPI002479C164|nr:ribitol 5-phosphate transferase FKRP [Uranotaenia lowii]XP_055600953.1 ribitol 5-phosphate transferase FKRP [Uranotaenia lowii]XP_055600955.1 ribitol 5-phosphate transferase FKRP [Uranotaenia lowii]XP_055600956.1 ribitol 5-phosphate transferase FKRP [Uranotaenia lowii]XP_055600957.1 ribitol 5-phosphate transferase FKRP [Uranotaenia lowii]